MNRFIQPIYPKEVKSTLDRKRLNLIILFCFGMVAVMILSAIVTAITEPTFEIYTVLVVAIVFFSSPLLVLKLSSDVRKTSIYFVLLLFGNNVAFNLIGGGFDYRVIIWILLYTHLTFFLIGRVGGSVAAVSSMIFAIVIWLLKKNGVELADYINLPAQKSMDDGFISFVLMMGLSFILSYHFEKSQTSLSRKLKRESDRLENILTKIKVGSWDYNFQTQSGSWTDELYEIFDIKRDEMPPIEEGLKMYREEFRTLIAQSFDDLAQKGKPYDISVIALTSKGQEKWVRLIGLERVEVNGELIKVSGVIQDIDHLKKAEEAIKANELAQKSLEFKNEFLAKMSHEIRTPLNGIIGLFDLIQEDNLTKDQKDYLGIMKSSGDDLIQIVNDVLDITKLEAGKLELRSEPFDLSNLAKKSALLFASKSKEKGIVLKTEISPFATKFIGDSARITQIMNNLLSNAIKFTSEGEVGFVVTHKNGRIYFEVRDSGMGIPEDKMGSLFEKFEQIESNTIKRKDGTQSGTGLGLPICKELIELMGGELEVESVLGEGSTFKFTLDLSIGEKIEPIEVKDASKEEKTYDLEVLLVDDKLVNLTVGKLLLEKIGCTVELARDGKDASDMAIEGQYDLILMDIQMPVMDGVASTNAIKSKMDNPPLIVGLSANNMEGDKEKYLSQGLDDYLAKPIKKEKLEALFNQYFPGRGRS